MNITLWLLQVLLAAAFAAHRWMLVSPPPELLPIMDEQLGVAFRLFLGVAEIAGAVGILLPAMTRKLPWLTPLAAGCLAFVVASATVLHLSRGETSAAVTTAILSSWLLSSPTDGGACGRSQGGASPPRVPWHPRRPDSPPPQPGAAATRGGAWSKPRAPDPRVVRPLDKHRGSRG